jgi:hypothetical protein
MTAPLRRGAARTLVGLTVAGVAGALTLSPLAAYAADGVTPVATYAGPGVGYNGVIDGHAAGTVDLTFNAQTLPVFCVDYAKNLATSGDFTAQTWSAASIPNIAKAADIAVKHNGLPGRLADQKAENAAAQLAIWHYTNNLDYSKVPNAQIVARANALVKLATPLAEQPSSYHLAVTESAAGTGTASTDTLTATVTTAQGTAISGIPVVLAANGKTATVTTSSTGAASLTVPAPAKAGTGTANFTTNLAGGTIFVPTGGKQPMVSTAGAQLSRSGSAALAAARPAPAPVITPTPVVVVTPTPVITPTPVVVVTPTPVITPSPVVTTIAPKPVVTTPAPKVTTAAPVVHHSPKPKPTHTSPAPKVLPHTGGWEATWMFGVAAAVCGAGFLARRRLRQR